MPGFSELVLILIVVLVIFGAGKLPAIANAIGEAVVKIRDQASSSGDECDSGPVSNAKEPTHTESEPPE